MTEPASDELIAEIEAGLEGVTPGEGYHAALCHPLRIAALIARIREQDATIKRMDKVLEWICDGPHEITMTYPELVAEISTRARAARKEPT